ncbi:hypothetical protein [Xanthomarina sp. F2636L]|uniref:hypothetical protein n=1 Tax=Xanthomarina sp. F2636L TaxID=2996018 RepID=UPI00225DD71C|nr:hypothetical protein [Xanthomarina sp. F2636L]MCX7550193.1 hypothetical protein [Xanthomarina sp. F2636L]
MSLKNRFGIGDIVTFKTHPLLYDRFIKGDGKLVPPFMVVKEVYFEDKKKKVVDTNNGKTIGERIKYTCLFFDDNKSEFNEVIVYESMLMGFEKFYISRMDGEKNEEDSDYESVIDEVCKYKDSSYKYGNIVYFKTKKLEILKKRSSVKNESIKKENDEPIIEKRETFQYVVNYSTPEFVLCGYKEELGEDLFYPNGNKKKIISKILYKVKWFNSHQMKFSEQYLPMKSLIDVQPFITLVPHNLELDKKDLKS